MMYHCDACGLSYDLTVNEDYLHDNRVGPQEVVTPAEVIHKCKARNDKWRLMKRQKEKTT